MLNFCAYQSCRKQRKDNPGLKMFRIPIDSRMDKWIANIGNPNLIGMKPKTLHNKYVCQEHFDVSSFMDPKAKHRLVPSAIPLPYSELSNSPSTSKDPLSISSETKKTSPTEDFTIVPPATRTHHSELSNLPSTSNDPLSISSETKKTLPTEDFTIVPPAIRTHHSELSNSPSTSNDPLSIASETKNTSAPEESRKRKFNDDEEAALSVASSDTATYHNLPREHEWTTKTCLRSYEIKDRDITGSASSIPSPSVKIKVRRNHTHRKKKINNELVRLYKIIRKQRSTICELKKRLNESKVLNDE